MVPRLQLSLLERFHVDVSQIRPLFSDLLAQETKALGGDLDLEHLPHRSAGFVERLQVPRSALHSLQNPRAETLSPEVQLEVQREKKTSGRRRSSTRTAS